MPAVNFIFLRKTLYFFNVIKYNNKKRAEDSMDKEILERHIDELCAVLLKLKSKEDCRALLEDLCTYKEVEQMALRAYAAKLFLEGKTYSAITAETELSSATLSRISRCIGYGRGGYRKLLAPTEPKE